jgi:hypothetical protein
MSVKASFWAIEQRPRSRDHKLVLMLLADWADENWRSLAEDRLPSPMKSMCSVRHVIDLLNGSLRRMANFRISPNKEAEMAGRDQTATSFTLMFENHFRSRVHTVHAGQSAHRAPPITYHLSEPRKNRTRKRDLSR